MTSLLLVLLLSQNTPRHPSPATNNNVPVGNGVNWVSKPVPQCNIAQAHLGFETTTNTWTCVSNSVPVLWSTYCPAGVFCNSSTNTFLSWYEPKNGTQTGKFITCNAITSGTTVGTATIHIYDGTSDIGTCDIPCSTTRAAATCSTSGFSLTPGVAYRVYATVAGLCTTLPQNLWCNIPLEAP